LVALKTAWRPVYARGFFGDIATKEVCEGSWLAGWPFTGALHVRLQHVAVCRRPGTELAFENDVQTGGFLFRKKIGDRLARFRQIAFDQPSRHHDALEFSNGAVVLVTDLAVGQRATVLQLPASPMDEKIETPQPAARYEAADI
jgi:hypothetical protein